MMLNVQELIAIFGSDRVCIDKEVCSVHSTDWSKTPGHAPLAILYPRSTEEVSKMLAYCNEKRCAVVPQGGLTGLSGGATVQENTVALSLERLKGVISIDSESATLTAWAGTTLQELQEQAQEAGFLLPLDLGARGSCQIGGNVSTNAGGNRVIRYGMTRDLILGLEVVLADGTVLPMLNTMIKNNTGFDLKQLFIGAEGTLGIITQVVLKLSPKVGGANTALLALDSFDSVIRLLRYSQSQLSNLVSAFEVMWQEYYVAALDANKICAPVAVDYPLYVLMDLQANDAEAQAEAFEAVLEHAYSEGWVQDAAISQSQSDTNDFWSLRDAVSELLPRLSPLISLDVSFPMNHIEAAVEELVQSINTMCATPLTTYVFGHVGDNNIHLTAGPAPVEDAELIQAIKKRCYEITAKYQGAISAEHGIGIQKRDWLPYSRSEQEIEVMRQLKAALDSNHILNPNKIFTLN